LPEYRDHVADDGRRPIVGQFVQDALRLTPMRHEIRTSKLGELLTQSGLYNPGLGLDGPNWKFTVDQSRQDKQSLRLGEHPKVLGSSHCALVTEHAYHESFRDR